MLALSLGLDGSATSREPGSLCPRCLATADGSGYSEGFAIGGTLPPPVDPARAQPRGTAAGRAPSTATTPRRRRRALARRGLRASSPPASEAGRAGSPRPGTRGELDAGGLPGTSALPPPPPPPLPCPARRAGRMGCETQRHTSRAAILASVTYHLQGSNFSSQFTPLAIQIPEPLLWPA